MKNKFAKSFMIVLALAMCALSMTSCNRGIGCPSDFSVAQDIIQPVATAIVQQVK